VSADVTVDVAADATADGPSYKEALETGRPVSSQIAV